ncbi:efflux RND transporter periplasmic adaptor subunit [Limimaricola litoreus]|uniref:Efflux RND transporter periplasmic adaptor subunit n=1 Tax=Limimaricola litoreus TaxID=2955316 RepID=A0A9X2FNV9_9RHOB|nr:efflux RND transporter periplasmic adaptor subunit [Limimaricola litoreus]MCP1168536.1 efflux RND transporter periplasmic adaptor subunit [Limimaricola litoreus]
MTTHAETEAGTDRAPLSFEGDKGASKSKFVAGGLVLALLGWMGSGVVLPIQPERTEAPAEEAPRRVAVAVQDSVARAVAQVFVAEGQALAERDTQILAETGGQIAEVPVRRGAEVTAGEAIARFETAQGDADLRRAQEERNRAQREFDNAQTLLERGTSTVDRVAQARSTLAAAEAAVTAAEEALADTVVRAPFDGRIEALEVEQGEFVNAGAQVARIVDNTPLRIEIQIPQQQLSDIEVGQAAQVAFITGETATGEVRFVGRSADAQTRTFTAEIEVPNADGAIPAGISAQVRIATGEQVAHFVSPAILSLGTDGTLGIKTVDDESRVTFREIEIIRAQTDGIWVGGLPEQARIISVGQGFVNHGELVDARADETAAPETQAAPGQMILGASAGRDEGALQ